MAFGLSGCGGESTTAGPEQGASVQDIENHIGDKVTLSAEVDDGITLRFFSLAGTKDTNVKPLLVMRPDNNPKVQDGEKVEVTGTVRESFDVAALEEEQGIDLNESALHDWNGQPYVEATKVSVAGDAGY